MNDTVIFQGNSYQLPHGYSVDQIREALAEQAPAIMNAQVTSTQNADGSFTHDFAERAGTKG